jgi:hypothetical protein
LAIAIGLVEQKNLAAGEHLNGPALHRIATLALPFYDYCKRLGDFLTDQVQNRLLRL